MAVRSGLVGRLFPQILREDQDILPDNISDAQILERLPTARPEVIVGALEGYLDEDAMFYLLLGMHIADEGWKILPPRYFIDFVRELSKDAISAKKFREEWEERREKRLNQVDTP